MRHYVFFIAFISFFTGVLAPNSATAAPLLTAYALSAAGESAVGSLGPFSCATFARDPRTGNIGGGFEVSLPTSGPCGVGVDSRLASTASGGVTVSSSLAAGTGIPSPGDLRAFVGDSTGRAGFGNLGVRANATYSGSFDSGTVSGAQAFGRQTEPMTFGGASGAGVFRPTFRIDGSFFNQGRTDSQLAFLYSVGSGPEFTAFRIQNNRGVLSYRDPTGYVPLFPGMSLSGDLVNGFTVAGLTTFTLEIPIIFGTATDITYSLWAAALPSSSLGLLTPSATSIDFISTAKLTGIDVLDSSGRSVSAFSIVAGSGTLYDRNGVVGNAGPGPSNGVPEPGSLPLMVMGLFGAAFAFRRRI